MRTVTNFFSHSIDYPDDFIERCIFSAVFAAGWDSTRERAAAAATCGYIGTRVDDRTFDLVRDRLHLLVPVLFLVIAGSFALTRFKCRLQN